MNTLPRMLREMVEGISMLITMVALVIFLAYLMGRALTPKALAAADLLGPLISWLIFYFHPLNPYDNLYSSLEGISSESAAAKSPGRELVALLRSQRARAQAFRTGIWLAIFLLASTFLVSTLSKSLPADASPKRLLNDVLVGAVISTLGSVCIQSVLIIRWSVSTFKELN